MAINTYLSTVESKKNKWTNRTNTDSYIQTPFSWLPYGRGGGVVKKVKGLRSTMVGTRIAKGCKVWHRECRQ